MDAVREFKEERESKTKWWELLQLFAYITHLSLSRSFSRGVGVVHPPTTNKSLYGPRPLLISSSVPTHFVYKEKEKLMVP